MTGDELQVVGRIKRLLVTVNDQDGVVMGDD